MSNRVIHFRCTGCGWRMALLGLVVMTARCQQPPADSVRSPDHVTPTVAPRDVRVLILENVGEFFVRVDGPYQLRGPSGNVFAEGTNLPWTAVRGGEELSWGSHHCEASAIDVVPEPGARVWVSRETNGERSGASAYAGVLHGVRNPAGRLDVINLVDLDTYVAGVVASELYAHFHRETFRAQAVAARTYALYQMAQSAGRDYDVKATEASQVYQGLPRGEAGQKAWEAVRSTPGIICTWTSPHGEQIFCTFYSSACGGLSQDAADVMPVDPIPPLAGGVRCDYCRIATGDAYRWGPVSITKRDLTEKLVARYPSLASLGPVDRVEVAARTRQGRPRQIRVIGTTGKADELIAEDFRLVVGGRLMKSTDCRIEDAGGSVRFEDGRGFGHGVGLCQWGAEGQARLGRKAGEILKCYYPGMHLTRAY
jgi:stage II sporulation protein D